MCSHVIVFVSGNLAHCGCLIQQTEFKVKITTSQKHSNKILAIRKEEDLPNTISFRRCPAATNLMNCEQNKRVRNDVTVSDAI